ncbi:MAG TPA: crotonase/enoyl-CoA hydratase family protein [Myxococcota bacterium]|nr:crotonase/enoyl-CoA hydratase family protein [Myxococcota bacterium]
MGDLVTIEISGGVADVRLNRPEKYNALSREMFAALGEAGERLAGEPGVRAVVLSGNGRGFCAGLDFDSFRAMTADAGSAPRSGAPAPAQAKLDARPDNFFQRSAYTWKRLPVPVIAAVHGVAYGGGFQIALGADLRIARPDARFSILEIQWGLVPDVALTQTVRDVLRLDVVKELTWTGRVVDGREAQALGIVTRLADDPLAEAQALAREIAGRSPDAIRAGKRLLEEAWHADPAEGLALEARLQGSLIGTPNQVEAVKASLEKRPPRFRDPQG